MTDNRTNEQIVAEALREMPDAGPGDRRDPAMVVAGYAVAALETTGRLVGQPTDEQVEAAARAIYGDDPAWGYVNDYGGGDIAAQWEHLGTRVQEMFRLKARAALVAAQGAAPRGEAYDHCCNHPKCPGGSLCCCASEQRLRDGWNQWREEIAGDAKQAFRDGYHAGQNDPAPWLTAPVLPSSGVDEAALAEVRRQAAEEAWDAGCLAGMNRKHHANMTEEQAEKAWPNPYRAGQGRVVAECFPSMTDPMYCTEHCSGEACATRGFYPCCGLCTQSDSALAGKENNDE